MTGPAAGTRRERLRPALWAMLAAGTALAAAAAAGALGDTTAAVLAGTAGTRAGMDVAGVACVGAALVGVLLPHGPREADTARSAADRLLVAAGAGWLVLVLAGIAFRAADAFGKPVTAVTGADLLLWSTDLAAGRGLVLTAGCALVVLGCGVLRLRDPDRVPVRVPLVAALLGVLTPAVTGHASSAPDHQVAVITAALHVAAAALWVGGLAALLVLVARRRGLLDVALPRYSRIAGGCLAVVAVSGVANAAVRVGSWAALTGTGYGLLVLGKTAALLALAGLGGLARRRLATGRAPVLRWAGVEVTLMAVTIGLAAALTQTAP